jgi:uncharacterized protein
MDSYQILFGLRRLVLKTIISAVMLGLLIVSTQHVYAEDVTPPGVPPAAGADEAKRDDIRKLLLVTGSAQMGKVVLQNVMAQYKKSMPDVPQKFWDDFMKDVDSNELIELCVASYEKNLSHEDIKATVAFYESEAGKRYVAAQSNIVQENMKAGQAWTQGVAQKLLAKLKAEGLKK